MYEAFELFRLVEKLPLKICAIATWGEYRATAQSALRDRQRVVAAH